MRDKTAFEYIRSYSPYDQLTPRDYPPVLVTAGLNDPRVTYWEPAKYVAKLRALKTDENLVLLKTNMGAGPRRQVGEVRPPVMKWLRSTRSSWRTWGKFTTEDTEIFCLGLLTLKPSVPPVLSVVNRAALEPQVSNNTRTFSELNT